MAGMLPPLIRTRQPQQATGISAYWRGKGLVFVHNPAIGEINLADSRAAINTTGFPSDVGIAGRRINAAGASKSEFTDNGLASSGNSLTLISIWRSKDSQYASDDASRFLLSTRTAGNAGWGWGRSSAIAGGATGNLTGQTFVLNGVAQYSEANSTIESLVDTVVAMRVNGTTASWFRFGKKSSTDTTVGTASTGATAIFGAGGPYSGAANIWNDRAYLTLAFNKPLSDADIYLLTNNVNAPWQIFAPIPRNVFADVAGGGSQTLSPPLYNNSQSFYAPTLAPGSVTITPGLLANTQSFYVPTVSIAGGPQQLTASRLDNAPVFYAPTLAPGAVTVTTSLYNNSQTFYSLTLTASKTLSAALFTNAPTFYAPIVSLGSGPQVISPPLLVNAQSYFTQIVTPGQVSLFPALLTNSQTYYSHVLNQAGGQQSIAPSLLTNGQAFYSPTVAPGAVAVVPSLYSNTQAFYNLTLTTSKTLTAALHTNSSAFYSPLVSLGGAPLVVDPALFSNLSSFFSHTVTPGAVSLYPLRLDNTQSFYLPSVGSVVSGLTLTPSDISAIAAAVLAALNATTIPVDMQKTNGVEIVGDGTSGDKFRSVLYVG